MTQTTPTIATQPLIPPGRIDIHSHILPGVDDGCADIDEVIESIEMLKHAGFVGSICTPHIWIDMFPDNTSQHIAVWVDQLKQELTERNINYHLWTGGELRLFDGVIDWCKNHGVPTLADSKCVLIDFWVDKWSKWINKTFTWLLAEGYTPILAHPERLNIEKKLEPHIDELVKEGVLLQGNFQCMTGEAGYHADARIRQWLGEDRYTFFAIDMHRPDSLVSRLDGMTMVETEFGRGVLDQLTRDNPREIIFGE